MPGTGTSAPQHLPHEEHILPILRAIGRLLGADDVLEPGRTRSVPHTSLRESFDDPLPVERRRLR
ncbi:MAG: hypothetical protein ACREKI_09865, partial [Gemmatimonadota bacterium]